MRMITGLYLFFVFVLFVVGCSDEIDVLNIVDDVIGDTETSISTAPEVWYRNEARDITLQIPEHLHRLEGLNAFYHHRVHISREALLYNNMICCPSGNGEKIYTFNMKGELIGNPEMEREAITKGWGAYSINAYKKDWDSLDRDGFIVDNLMYRNTTWGPIKRFGRDNAHQGYVIWDLDTKEVVNTVITVRGQDFYDTPEYRTKMIVFDDLVYKIKWKRIYVPEYTDEGNYIGHARMTIPDMTLYAYKYDIHNSDGTPVPERNIPLQIPEHFHIPERMIDSNYKEFEVRMQYSFTTERYIYLQVSMDDWWFLGVWTKQGEYVGESELFEVGWNMVAIEFYDPRTKTVYGFHPNDGTTREYLDNGGYRVIHKLIAFSKN